MNNRKMIQRKPSLMLIAAIFSLAFSIIMGSSAFSGSIVANAAASGDWSQIKGTYSMDGGNQYNTGRLQLLPLDESILLFEFDRTEGREASDTTTDFRLAGTLFINENGIGQWEEETENGPVSLTFVPSGKSVEITQNGDLPISVKGRYTRLEDSMEMTTEAAEALLRALPSAATSLSGNNGPYRLEASEVVVDGWFYDIKAVFTDTGAVIGEYLIAIDMSAVYRIDTETPVLIHGSADSMMKAAHEIWLDAGEGDSTTAADDTSSAGNESPSTLSVPLVDSIPASSLLEAGKTMTVTVRTPGEVPAAITARSSNPAAATVDSDGSIRGIAPGTATISGAITVDKAQKSFQFDISVWSPAIEDVNIRTVVPVGTKITMQARVTGVDAPLKWHVSDSELADVDSTTGVLTGKKQGQITLQASAGDLVKEWAVTIEEVASASKATDKNKTDSSPISKWPLMTAVLLAAAFGLMILVIMIKRNSKRKTQV